MHGALKHGGFPNKLPRWLSGALWQTANRANARLKATLGGFHGPLTFFIESQSFFANSFDPYPMGEKTEATDSEKRTPEIKFLPFFSTFQQIAFSHKIYIFAPQDRANAEGGWVQNEAVSPRRKGI